MLELKSKKAAQLFEQRKYAEALALYRQLSVSVNNSSFVANIYLCEKNLGYKVPPVGLTKKRIQCADISNALSFSLLPAGSPVDDHEYDPLKPSKSELTDGNPLLFECLLDDVAEIKLNVELTNDSCRDDDNAGLLALSFFDASQNAIEIDHPSFGHSQKFPNYKYLRVGSNELEFKVPVGAVALRFEIRKWKASRPIFLNLPLNAEWKSELEVERLAKWLAPGFVVPPLQANEMAPLAVSILDEFSERTFGYDLRLLPVGPDDWSEVLTGCQPDMLFVESAWKGNAGAWQYALTNPRNPKHEELKCLVTECKRRNIPTVFWNKEDPPNYNVFLESAKLFDYIFTTDANCIPSYKAACGHDNIYALPFAAQPKIHNPIGKTEKEGREIAFAGTWYANKHQERCSLAPLLFDPALSRGLTIFNRMSDWVQDDSYDFPHAYRQSVKPKISYHEMLSVHKLFKIFLNINSVIDSPTMFSRRVFEVLAASTPVLSTASFGVADMFTGIVPVIADREHAAKEIDRLLSDDISRKKIGHRGHRKVMKSHTVRDRLRNICERTGVRYQLGSQSTPKVTWAVPTNRPDHLSFIKENFYRQTYPSIELIIALNSDDFNAEEVRSEFAGDARVRVIQLAERCSLGEVLNATIDEMSGDYWMKIDDDNIYLEHFTEDMILPFMYADCRIIGKGSYFAYLEASDQTILRFPGQDNRIVNFCSGSAIAVHRDVLIAHRFPDQSVGEDTVWMKQCLAAGEKIYSPDIFNYSVVRRSSKDSHTWKADDEALRKGARIVGVGKCLEEISA